MECVIRVTIEVKLFFREWMILGRIKAHLFYLSLFYQVEKIKKISFVFEL